MGRLEGKIAVVTGSGGGLGRAMSTAFAREGAAVVCQDLAEETASATAAAIGEAGGEALAWACDVTESAAVDEMFLAARERFGIVDVLINNAGVATTPGDASDSAYGIRQLVAMSDESIAKMLAIHVEGSFYTSRAMCRDLLDNRRPASIVCISSIVALTGFGMAHYAAAKGGLIGFVRTLAVHGGRYGIRANAIAPGMIETPMTKGKPEDVKFILDRTPLGRVGEADRDIAPLAVYLASEESSFLTGQTISPNGGLVSV